MYKICLFDLDDTLIRTEDLKDDREACANNRDSKNLAQIKSQLTDSDRVIYKREILDQIRIDFPGLKLGVFTRSPRSYTELLLDWAYPGFEWDIIVAYEDVRKRKPHGDGIDAAIAAFGVKYLNEVMMVGDVDIDIRSAYNCGCLVTLDKGAWPNKRTPNHWRALELIPDAIIDSPEELLKVLEDPDSFLPELEHSLIEGSARRALSSCRFDKINHFIAKAAGGTTQAYPIYVAGRSFSNYASLEHRRKWHELTESIANHKEADQFPEAWVETVRTFIAKEFVPLFGTRQIVVSVIPHRPGRTPRLENFLVQLKASIADNPISRRTVLIEPELLTFSDGVKSQHNDLLGRDDRFINVRDHLSVNKTELIAGGRSFLIIDDVTTTGASLIYANKYLTEAGAYEVKCLSMAKNVTDVLK